MQKGFADSNPWAQWPQIFDDKSFMNQAKVIIKDEADEFHDYLISKTSEQFEFDNLDKMVKLECLIKHLGGYANVDPSAETCDSSVGTFTMFVLRDALEYAGLLPAKKRSPHREFNLCNFKQKLYQE